MNIRGILEKLVALLTDTQTTIAEFQSSLALFLLTKLFWDSSPTLSSLEPYAVMVRVAPEWLWGLVCFVIATFQTIGNLKKRSCIRRVAAFSSSIFAAFVVILIALSDAATPPLVAFCLATSLVQFVVYLRLSLAHDGKAALVRGAA